MFLCLQPPQATSLGAWWASFGEHFGLTMVSKLAPQANPCVSRKPVKSLSFSYMLRVRGNQNQNFVSPGGDLFDVRKGGRFFYRLGMANVMKSLISGLHLGSNKTRFFAPLRSEIARPSQWCPKTAPKDVSPSYTTPLGVPGRSRQEPT